MREGTRWDPHPVSPAPHLPAASATTSQMLVAVPIAVALSKTQRGCSSTKVLAVVWPLILCRVRIGLYSSSSAMKTR